MYKIYYNRKTIGDVLIIELERELIPDKIIKNNDVAALYKGDKLVGVNIFDFSKVVKLHHEGELLEPAKEFIEVVNYMLINANVEPLKEN